MIEVICQYPHQIVMGASALFGALVYAGHSIRQKKKSDKKFKFDATKIVDTVWQSTTAGVVAGIAISCSWYGIIVAMITGFGVDKIANKLKISEIEVFNLVQLIAGFVSAKDKKK